MRSEYPVKLLKTQYRMHPDISCIIGKTFYQGLLEDGNTMPSEPSSFKSAFVMIHLDNSCELFRISECFPLTLPRSTGWCSRN